ncbi:MAG: response regulator [Nitrospirota bacterium]|jgi:DNA-binding NtrC family response regulator
MACILLIEDDQDIRELFSELLVRAGHEVVPMENGVDAAKVRADVAADLVITDILMPERDGLEAIGELRRCAPDVKIIAISGGSKIGPTLYLDAAQALGAHRTLAKPVDTAELLGAVNELLGERATSR